MNCIRLGCVMSRNESEVSDDAELVRCALAHDHDAYRQIVVRYESRLISYLARMLGDYELARDIAQETFVGAYAALDQWRATDGATLSPWLYRIATNRALNALRARQSRGGPQPSLTTVPEAPAAGQPFEDQLALRELLHAALQTLSEEDAACLVLRVVAGEHYPEIAERLGLTAEAVRKRVSRGLATLRTAYLAMDTEAHE
jgi:RNA polymerase sigma-70 factor, ECF subfamily